MSLYQLQKFLFDINRDRETFLEHIQRSLEPELKKIGLVLSAAKARRAGTAKAGTLVSKLKAMFAGA